MRLESVVQDSPVQDSELMTEFAGMYVVVPTTE
jgi:hypothetical protein